MSRVLAKAALLVGLISTMSGCCLGTWFWNNDRAYNVDLGKIGSGEQVISSPNEKQPWQGDKVERGFGL